MKTWIINKYQHLTSDPVAVNCIGFLMLLSGSMLFPFLAQIELLWISFAIWGLGLFLIMAMLVICYAREMKRLQRIEQERLARIRKAGNK